MFAGFMTSLVTNPVDVVRTRLMNEMATSAVYRNPVMAFFKVGPQSFLT